MQFSTILYSILAVASTAAAAAAPQVFYNGNAMLAKREPQIGCATEVIFAARKLCNKQHANGHFSL
jgi:hypothetical protein